MNLALMVALGGVAALLLVLSCVLLAALLSGRRHLSRELLAAQADLAVLQARLDSLVAGPVPEPDDDPGYLITDAGAGAVSATVEASPGALPQRAVLSVVLGEPLLKLVAFGYGVRRALSAENRNRLAFEMRREVRRSRKARQRDLRAARRVTHAEQRQTQESAA